MHTPLQSLIKTGFALTALLAIGFLATLPAAAATARREGNGAIRFYDDNGNDRGYAWCLRRGGWPYGGWADCSYYSYPQCRAAGSALPAGDCEPNPFASQVAPQPGRRR